MKLVKHGEPGCGTVELEGHGEMAKFVKFAFSEFKSLGHGHYAELFDDDGKLIGSASYGVRQTF